MIVDTDAHVQLPSWKVRKVMKIACRVSRRVGIFVLSGALVVVLYSLVANSNGKRRSLTLDSYHLIRFGMTREQVEAQLGCPPGDYATRDVVYTPGQKGVVYQSWLIWKDDGARIYVRLDGSGRVADMGYDLGIDFSSPNESLVARLGRWFSRRR
jgi:hypothetical protein